jgi:drug/metabolite transporter (DMT)-like permease
MTQNNSNHVVQTVGNARSTHAQAGTRKASGIWLVALGAAIWGTDTLFRVNLLSLFSSIQIVFLEHLLLSLYAIPVIWKYRSEWRQLSLRELGAILFISWGGSGLATILFTAAFTYANPSVVLLLQKLQPILVFLMARVFLKEVLPRFFYLYLLVALFGTYLLTFGFHMSLTDFKGAGTIGALLAIAAAALWGGSTVMGRILVSSMSFEHVTAVRFLFALPFMAGAMSFIDRGWHLMILHLVTWSSFLGLFLQALLPGLISLLFYYRGLSNTRASAATLAELAFPATGVLINWVVFGQKLSIGQFVGFALIWIIVYRLSKDGSNEELVILENDIVNSAAV